jgi:hypothetical protein
MQPVPCAWCGVTAPLIRVHGHEQCAACGVNVNPCCQGGETCPVSLEEEPDA